MRNTQFSVDLLGDQKFLGFTDGRTWNGWACPYFPFDEAQKLVAAWRAIGWFADYDSEKDAFRFVAADEQQDDPEVFGSVGFQDKTLYPIGAGAWIWDEITED